MSQSSWKYIACGYLVLATCILLSVVNLQLWNARRPGGAMSDMRTVADVVDDRGVPLFLCEKFSFCPFEGGVTSDLTQVVFDGVERFSAMESEPPFVMAYSSTGQVTVSSEKFFEKHRESGARERLSSYFPAAEFELYVIEEDGRIESYRTFDIAHVLYIAP